MKNKPSTPLKHIPRRTCIACRREVAKRELVRLVCVPGGEVEVDLSGKKSGRGAYICSSRDCWENAVKTGKLEYALRTRIQPDNKEKLVNYAREFDNNKQSLDIQVENKYHNAKIGN